MDDLDRLRTEDPALPQEQPFYAEQPRSPVPWIALLALVAVIAGGLWWWMSRAPSAPAAPSAVAPRARTPETTTDPATHRGLGIGEPDPNLPAIGELDTYVRPLLATLSARPELAALLATDDLVRRFVVSVESVARGASPSAQVRAVAPRGAFTVKGAGGAIVIDPASYDRYDGLVRMVEDLEPEGLARLYGRLRPRLEEAYAELGVPGSFDAAMIRAIRHLLDTPDLPPSARVQGAKGTNYAYVDPTLEGLSAAQRQLLRLGPARAARVKAHLRQFGEALHIPAEQLPR